MITFSKKSWHYRLVDKFSSQDVSRMDFCAYTRNLALALILATVFTVIVSYVAVAMTVAFLYLTDTLLGLWPWGPLDRDGGSFTIVMTGSIFLMLGFIIPLMSIYGNWSADRKYKRLEAEWDRERRGLPPVQPEPSIIREWYASVKGKFCPRVEFV